MAKKSKDWDWDTKAQHQMERAKRYGNIVGILGLLALTPLAMASCIEDPILVQGTGGSGGGPPACMTPSDCPPTDNPCISAVCSGGFCGTTNTPFGIICDEQGALACDGMANCKPVNGQTCTEGATCLSGICADGVCCDTECTDTCKSCILPGAAGTCANIPQGQTDDNATQACSGAASACDGMGVCKSSPGQTCANAADCASGFCADGICCDTECTGTCVSCTAMGKGGGMDGVCEFVMANVDAADECANGACDGAGTCKLDLGIACTANAECLSGFCVDGVCCDGQCSGTCEACTAASKGEGQDGQCGFVKFDVDVDSECLNGACNGAGACNTSNGATCADGTECLSGFCADGVCCDTACTGLCEACSAIGKGQGTDGTCGPVGLGLDPANECMNGACNGAGVCNIDTGVPCMNNAQCATGFCVDGYCCDSACTQNCQSCNISGSTGKCTNVPVGQDDTMCIGVSSCDGKGSCKKELGQTCAVAGDCLSNFCVDNVCCNEACTTNCKACNLSGKLGTCSNVAQNADDGTCSGTTQSCDGSGNCAKENGQSCTMPGTICLSGNCADGVCCNSACTAQCTSCKNTGSVGTCSNIPAGSDDANASMTCSGATISCDGTGKCKKENGQTCTNGAADCLSGNCVDGVCCNSTCTGTCQTCGTGTCSNVAFGQDDPGTCTGTNQSCDGATSCKKEIGQSCTNNSDCLQGSCNGGFCSGASCNQLSTDCGPANNESCCKTGAITGGTFNRSDSAMYPATISSFQLDRYEVTVGRFRKFVNAYPGNKPAAGAGAHPLIANSGWNSAWDSQLPASQTALITTLVGDPFATWTTNAGANERLPINMVTWYLAFAFCAWDGGRLPTEAEWNYAASGGSEQRHYPWGATAPTAQHANYLCPGCPIPTMAHKVGAATSGNGKWSQADMSGNVDEWVLDLFDPYSATCTDCANLATGSSRVMRGGHFEDAGGLLPAKARYAVIPTDVKRLHGIRCARMTP